MRMPSVHKKGKNLPPNTIDIGQPKLTYKEKKEYETAQVSLSPSEYVDDLSMFEDDPKELHKFVVRTKFLIRRSYEYIQLIAFLKDKCMMYHCGVHPNIKKYDGFTIEIHHTPLTIEDIIYIILMFYLLFII